MQFCDECGSMMHNDDGVMVCSGCGASEMRDDEVAKQYVSTESQAESEIIESDPNANFEGKPTAKDVRCKECEHDEAWYTIKQTASADEPPTRFFKCKECGHRWREYS